MTNTMSVSDVTKDEQLNLTSDVQFSYGLNSPYPEEGQAPVPAASLNVGGDAMDNVYRMDNVARIEQQRPGTSFRERVFGGRFATTSDSPIGQMSVAHASNELNKDIRTWPIIRPNTADTSNGRRVLMGALRHWYSECTMTEFGVRGDFLFSTSNYDPTIAYYDHPTMRFAPYSGVGDDGHKAIVWERIQPVVADSGMTFDLGDEFTVVLKINENFGVPADGEVKPQYPFCYGRFVFASGRNVTDGSASAAGTSSLYVTYDYAQRRISIQETNDANDAEYTMNITDKVDGYIDTPSFITVRIVRNTPSQLGVTASFHHKAGITSYQYVSNANLLPNRIALTRVEATSVVPDTATTSLAHEGVQGIYLVKGNTMSIVEEDSWEIKLPWFNKPKWKNICVPAMQGNAWQLVHDLCTVYGLDFSPVHNTFTLSTDTGNNNPWPTGQGSSVVVQASTREIAETVDIYNYNYSIPRPHEFVSVWKSDRVFSVRTGERLEEIITLPEGTSLLDISQPIARNVQTVINWWKLPDSANVNSVYSVYDDDNIEVDPKSWNDSGGSVTLEHTENPNEVKMILQGPLNPLLSKETTFHLSMAGSDIPSLLIAASGIRGNKEKVNIRTGAGKARNLKRIGTEYDNPMVCNTRLTYDVGAKLASLHGTTLTRASGTFPPLKAHDFPAFPILKRGSFYKPTSIVDNPNNISVSEAVRFNPVEWVKDSYKGLTCGQFKAKWPNSICREVNISPLGKEHF